MNIRDAALEDAKDLAYLIDLAGEGLPRYLWQQMAERDQDPLIIGAMRAARDEGSFSYRNARIVEIEQSVAGMLLSYPLPVVEANDDTESSPPILRPLLELEAEAAGSWYINAIATYEQFRGRGAATALMSTCQNLALRARISNISLIVGSENTAARALYSNLGYREVASRPLVAFPGGPNPGEWLLMVKDLH